MAILRRSGGKVDISKIDLSLKGIVLLVVAFAVILAAYEGGKWVLGKTKSVAGGLVPQSAGAGAELDAALGL